MLQTLTAMSRGGQPAEGVAGRGVSRDAGAALDGDFTIALADDGNTHRVRIVLGR
jgi:hypothetical protein